MNYTRLNKKQSNCLFLGATETCSGDVCVNNAQCDTTCKCDAKYKANTTSKLCIIGIVVFFYIKENMFITDSNCLTPRTPTRCLKMLYKK